MFTPGPAPTAPAPALHSPWHSTPLFSPPGAQTLFFQDWDIDRQGADVLGMDLFFEAVYHMVDIWCTTISVEDYVAFINRCSHVLFDKMDYVEHPDTLMASVNALTFLAKLKKAQVEAHLEPPAVEEEPEVPLPSEVLVQDQPRRLIPGGWGSEDGGEGVSGFPPDFGESAGTRAVSSFGWGGLLDLDLGADLMPHRTPGEGLDGFSDDSAYRPAMPYDALPGPRRPWGC